MIRYQYIYIYIYNTYLINLNFSFLIFYLIMKNQKRETDPVLRTMLVEALILLTHSRFGRDYLRKKQVYRVIQRLHAQETDDDIKEKCHTLVDMLIREEPNAEITELDNEDEDEDMVIEEIA